MELYLDNTMRWVKEVWRVLKPSGSFVLNIGDTFVNTNATESNNKYEPSEKSIHVGTNIRYRGSAKGLGGFYKAKQLLSVSSFAYCRIVSETDFVCRGEHIWCKPNVPSPIRSRLKHSHEKLFWFVKDADKYYFEKGAWMKKITSSSSRMACVDSFEASLERGRKNARTNDEQLRYMRGKAKGEPIKDRNNAYGEDQSSTPNKRGCGMTNEETIEHSWRIIPVGAKQSGFELHDKPASEHIAPFPEELIRPYIKSLCPQDGVALDPFLGSGTTMRVCLEEQRDCIGIELNEKYAEYAKKRVNDGGRL